MKFTTLLRARLIINSYVSWIKESDKVLDIGCGNCVVAQEIRDRFNCKIIGYDIIKYKNETGIPAVIASKIPFKEKKFDIAMLNDVLHHCNNKKEQIELLKESKKAARKVLVFEIKPDLNTKIFDFFLNKIHYAGMKISFNYRTREEWIKLFKRLGFKVESKQVKRMWYYPVIHYAFRLS